MQGGERRPRQKDQQKRSSACEESSLSAQNRAGGWLGVWVLSSLPLSLGVILLPCRHFCAVRAVRACLSDVPECGDDESMPVSRLSLSLRPPSLPSLSSCSFLPSGCLSLRAIAISSFLPSIFPSISPSLHLSICLSHSSFIPSFPPENKIPHLRHTRTHTFDLSF